MVTAFAIAHVLGFLTSLKALMSTRTAPGAVAWILALNFVPLLSVPVYWVFGRRKFQGYVLARKELEEGSGERVRSATTAIEPYVVRVDDIRGDRLVGQRLARLPYLRGNAVELLVDGEATFESILAGIDAAREYVLVQFYTVRDDDLGCRLGERLIAKAEEGVEVWMLYDEVGSPGLPGSYCPRLRDAGVHVTAFHSTRGAWNRFQINFRNHRKIVVADGRVGWIGGHNVGDEYLGRDPELGPWRDTHLRVEGPAVLELQLSFAEDWRWASDEPMELSWQPVPAPDGDATVLVLPSGPADRLDTASLMFQQAIHSARDRIWIASPYFVPDEGVMSALHLAALRDVEVRVLIPEMPDSKLVYYSAFAFAAALLRSGVEIYRYPTGLMHQKVFLVDDVLAAIGTANLDNRSFRLNFEVTALVLDETFVAEVEAMLERDFSVSKPMTVEDVESKPFWFRALSRASYLTAPIQ